MESGLSEESIMTLVLTQISKSGITMAADTAITYSRKKEIKYGATKLHVLQNSPVAISAWGGFKKANILRFFEEFVNKHEDAEDIDDLAKELEGVAREIAEPIDIQENPWGTVGFHLAGLTQYGDKTFPTFYHVHNGRSQELENRHPKKAKKLDPTLVNANQDLPPRVLDKHFKRTDYPVTVRNGDWELYALILDQALEPIIQGINQNEVEGLEKYNDLKIPESDDLTSQEEFLCLQIQFMTSLYQVSNMRLENEDQYKSHIGGSINTVRINKKGEVVKNVFENPGVQRQDS